MTPSEAIELARLKAEELNVPWSSEAVIAKRRRVWPFPPVWRVIAHVQRDNLTVTMAVRERTREAIPCRALYAADAPVRNQPRFLLFFVFKLAVSGSIFWLFARYWMGWPIWGATLFAIPCSYLGMMLYNAFRAPRRSGKDDEETDEA